MTRTLLFVFLSLCSIAACAQGIVSADIPLLPETIVTPTNQYFVSATSATYLSLNPAGLTLAQELVKDHSAAEYDYISVNPSDGPTVSTQILTGITRIGSVDLRLSKYSANSSSQPLLASEGLPFRFTGRALEIVASKMVDSKTSVGVAIIPEDESSIISSGLVDGKAESNLQFRAGFNRYLNEDKNLMIGVTCGYEDGKTRTVVSPLITGLPEDIVLEGKYRVNTYVGGLAYQPRLGTIIEANYLYQQTCGEETKDLSNFASCSLTQFITPKAALNAAYGNNGLALCGYYSDHGWTLSGGYTNRTFTSTEPFIGKSSLYWGALSKAF